ncbi:NAD(P)-dependent oxidoreductase [Rhabdobacter roseus]|uniref:Nucleoside-diphosphate-sugar epimerase n=1 Tax=Rhabdobacter roseus TaxID=1655419 RepID=A0A840TRT1_9BACT|nr:NAD-dependent epimerase/dehydratase family protein [Rhabdobacter roseus]MBB5286631.1 nucleoside-diphosphate-sugar epimerase [Rhabdobacter roseus]
MSDKVLITGASGFIGQHLVRAALQEGYDVHAAVRPSSELGGLRQLGTLAQGGGSLTLVYPDYRSAASLVPLLQEGTYAYIIHAAGATRAKDLAAYNQVNATYTLHLAQAALAAGIPLKRFVFMSSLAALGPAEYAAQQPLTEATRPNPVTWYGASKLRAERYLMELKALPLTIIRPTAVYGPGEKDLFILFKTLSRGLDLYIGRQPQRLSFVYVQDLVAATMAALKAPAKPGSTYNISDGRAYDRYALAQVYRELSGKSPYRLHVPLPLIALTATLLEASTIVSKSTPVLNKEKIKELTAANWYCSIETAQKELNYRPSHDLRSGMAETLAWYQEHHWL